MARSDFVRRSFKFLAALALTVGAIAAFVGLVGGLSMGGSILQGETRGDILRVGFIVLPMAAACLFVVAVAREATRPKAAIVIYCGAVSLVGAQLVLPALS